jgi:hypothetical protein
MHLCKAAQKWNIGALSLKPTPVQAFRIIACNHYGERYLQLAARSFA